MSQATVIFSAPIAGSKTEDRVIVEHGDGRWSVGRMARADRTKLAAEEVTFDVADLRTALLAALQSDPSIQTMMNKQAGKCIAAGALLLMQAIGLDDAKIDASSAGTEQGRAA